MQGTSLPDLIFSRATAVFCTSQVIASGVGVHYPNNKAMVAPIQEEILEQALLPLRPEKIHAGTIVWRFYCSSGVASPFHLPFDSLFGC